MKTILDYILCFFLRLPLPKKIESWGIRQLLKLRED